MSDTPEIDARIRQLEAEQKVLIRLLTEKPERKPAAQPEPEKEPENPGSGLGFGCVLIVALATPVCVVIAFLYYLFTHP